MRRLEHAKEDIFRVIKERCEQGVPPTVREICEELQISSTSTAHKYLIQLEEEGLITRGKGTNRNIRLAKKDTKKIPLIGTVAAGMPITAQEQVECYIPYNPKNSGEYFALRVKGDSMINAGILPGDVIVVKSEPVAQDGEIVVAMIDGEATVKRFYQEEGRCVLKPENDKYPYIYATELTILGKVVSLIRDF